MSLLNRIRIMDNSLGRGLSSIFDDTCEETATSGVEEEIRAKVKSLKDERDTHNLRIAEIDAEIAKLENELSVLTEERITELEAEYSQCEDRMRSIQSQLEQLKATPATT
ncbi:MAG: hypothetical protein J6D45_02150 [Clostridia bacterium]|nr:hypothetical protein [Clostridia bacterium]